MRRRARLSIIAAAGVVMVVGLAGTAKPTSIFQGFGGSTPGGLGGALVRVTTLADSGPGSLRAALRGGGNRTIVFDIAGEIALNDYLSVAGPYVTIDGFTAPPPGITLKDRGLLIRGSRNAHDIVVRGIRVRNSAKDGIQIAYGAYNVVIDHVSVAGSGDGNIDITEDAHDITISWSIVGGNAKNMLIKYRASRVTVHHNLFTESVTRNPQVRVDDSSTATALETTADIRNNLIANWGGGYGTLLWFGPWANVVGNYYSSRSDALTIASARVFAEGNQSPGGAIVNGWATLVPFPAPTVDTQDACTAAAAVVAEAGARPLDATDVGFLARVGLPTPCNARG